MGDALQNRTKFLFGALIVLVAVASYLALRLMNPPVSTSPASPTAPSTPADAPQLGASRESSTSSLGNRQARVTTVRRSSYLDFLMSSKNLFEAYQHFNAMEKDPAAQYYKSLIVSSCQLFSARLAEPMRTRIDRQAPDAVLKKTRLDALDAQIKMCEGMSTIGDVRPGDLVAAAAKLGDPKARAILVANEADSKRDEPAASQSQNVAQELARLRDGEVMTHLASYFFTQSEAGASWQIPGLDSSATGFEIGNAWRLAACEFGADCSPSEVRARGRCIMQGVCDVMDLHAEFSQLYTPQQMSRLNVIRDIIVAGVETGIWPDRFWVVRRAGT